MGLSNPWFLARFRVVGLMMALVCGCIFFFFGAQKLLSCDAGFDYRHVRGIDLFEGDYQTIVSAFPVRGQWMSPVFPSFEAIFSHLERLGVSRDEIESVRAASHELLHDFSKDFIALIDIGMVAYRRLLDSGDNHADGDVSLEMENGVTILHNHGLSHVIFFGSPPQIIMAHKVRIAEIRRLLAPVGEVFRSPQQGLWAVQLFQGLRTSPAFRIFLNTQRMRVFWGKLHHIADKSIKPQTSILSSIRGIAIGVNIRRPGYRKIEIILSAPALDGGGHIIEGALRDIFAASPVTAGLARHLEVYLRKEDIKIVLQIPNSLWPSVLSFWIKILGNREG